MDTTLIKHHDKLIIFQNRAQVLEVELPEGARYLPMNVFSEFKEFFMERAVFEPLNTRTVLNIYEDWKNYFTENLT
jgi:hypothetical protein